MMNLLRNEPVAIVGLLVAVVNLLMLFGVPLSEMQKAGIETVLTLALALGARAMVTPNNKLELPK